MRTQVGQEGKHWRAWNRIQKNLFKWIENNQRLRFSTKKKCTTWVLIPMLERKSYQVYTSLTDGTPKFGHAFSYVNEGFWQPWPFIWWILENVILTASIYIITVSPFSLEMQSARQVSWIQKYKIILSWTKKKLRTHVYLQGTSYVLECPS
jgi:hypothetical protein